MIEYLIILESLRVKYASPKDYNPYYRGNYQLRIPPSWEIDNKVLAENKLKWVLSTHESEQGCSIFLPSEQEGNLNGILVMILDKERNIDGYTILKISEEPCYTVYRKNPPSTHNSYALNFIVDPQRPSKYTITNFKSAADWIWKWVLSRTKYEHKKEIMNMIRDKVDDMTIYRKLRQCSTQFASENIADDGRVRISNQSSKLGAILQQTFPNKKFNSYLDVGSAEGHIAMQVGQCANINNVLLCDVRNICEYPNNFVQLSDEEHNLECAFENAKFDLITVSMVLHHIRTYPSTIQDLKKLLNPGGVLLIREHNCTNNYTAAILDVIHAMYGYVWPAEVESEDFVSTYFAYYQPQSVWKELICSTGLSHVKTYFENRVDEAFIDVYVNEINIEK